MLATLFRPLRQLAQSLTVNDSPRQVAWGFTLGMLIGLTPKGNLLAIMLTLLLLGLRTNKSAGLLAAGIFSSVGIFFDGFAHRIGSWILTWEAAQPLHHWLYESLLGPWLGINNTVVVGQLLIGLYLAYPAYWFAYQFAGKIQPRLNRWLLRYRVIRWLRGAELGTQWGTNV